MLKIIETRNISFCFDPWPINHLLVMGAQVRSPSELWSSGNTISSHLCDSSDATQFQLYCNSRVKLVFVLTGAVKIHKKYCQMIASRGSQWGKRLAGLRQLATNTRPRCAYFGGAGYGCFIANSIVRSDRAEVE